MRVHNERDSRRAAAGIASRAVAEMAICTCPTKGAPPCTDIDFDLLMADLVTMLDCAGQCDAHHYGLATGPLRVAANGSFEFDLGFLEQLHLPYLHAHGERAFRDAAEDYAEPFRAPQAPRDKDDGPEIAPEFAAAIQAEFGMCLEDLVGVTFGMTEAALRAGASYLSLRRSEVLACFAGSERVEAVDAERAFRALVLRPRPRWDEDKPEGALARDWQPWRMDRKLSLTRRPLIQLEDGQDPEVLVFPALMDRVVRRMLQLADGRLPAEMFDTRAVERWIGGVVDQRGHAFNRRVAEALRDLGLGAEPDVRLTRLGGGKALGDVDVLAWSRETGEIWATECKRLLLDRTVGEIGERLADYTTPGVRNGKRTPIQRHLDRLAFLRLHRAELARFAGIEEHRLVLKSALITDALVPMQFTSRMTQLVDRICDFRSLSKTFQL